MKNNKGASMIAYRSFFTPLNTIEGFSKAGYDTICLFPAHTKNSLGEPYSQYPPTWLWYDKIDFTPFDKMVADVSSVMPDAKILLMIDLNSPIWLEHKEWESVTDSFNNLGRAVCNPRWIEAIEYYLKEFVSYANEKYGDRILAYLLASGATDEWYDYSLGTESRDRRRAFREWQISKTGVDPVDIPPISVRDGASHEDFLKNPKTEGIGIDYWRFCNDSIANAILRFARITREIVGDKAEIGCFYGYILEKSDSALVSCGHLEYEKVLDCPDIDFLISPGTYTDRKMGGGSGFLIPAGTAAVRGKRLLHECDQRTNTYNPYLSQTIKLPWEHWKTESETLAGIKREASLGIIKNTNLWWFDMWGGYYQSEAVMKLLSKVKTLWDTYSGTPTPNAPCEVALIVDPDSTYLVNQEHERTPEINLGTRNKLNRLGAPFEVYSFGDIPKIQNFEKYKFVIFTSLFCIDKEKQKILNDYVLRDGRHVLWLYAPGIYTDGVFDTENCKNLTGIDYKTDGLSSLDMGTWHSHYVYEYSSLTVEHLKSILKESGATEVCEEKIPVYARDRLLSVHTKEGGKMKLKTPYECKKAKDLFTDREYEVKDGVIECELSSPDTALFLLS